MTICNMSIEMGARGGMIAPDETLSSISADASSPRKAPNGTPPWSVGAR